MCCEILLWPPLFVSLLPGASAAQALSPTLSPDDGRHPAAVALFGPSETGSRRPAFTPPTFDPSVERIAVRTKDGRTIWMAWTPPSVRAPWPKRRVVCGTTIIEADARGDPRMVRQVERNPDPRIATPPPACGKDTERSLLKPR